MVFLKFKNTSSNFKLQEKFSSRTFTALQERMATMIDDWVIDCMHIIFMTKVEIIKPKKREFFTGDCPSSRLKEATAIKRTAVRETIISRHHGAHSDTPRTITALYRTEGFKGDPELVPHYAERRQPVFLIFCCLFFSPP